MHSEASSNSAMAEMVAVVKKNCTNNIRRRRMLPVGVLLALVALQCCCGTAEARVISAEDVLNGPLQYPSAAFAPFWRSPSGLAPSFSPFTPPATAEASGNGGGEEEEEEGTVVAASPPDTVVGSAGGRDNLKKRRLVVRVPFAQNPDNLQLSRIYKSLFDPSQQSRAKKYGLEGYGLRRFVPFF